MIIPIPMEIMNKIMLFMSHPIADIIRPEIANYINYYDHDNISFVEFFILKPIAITKPVIIMIIYAIVAL